MKRRGFLAALAGIAAAVPVVASSKPFKRISGIRVEGADQYGKPVAEEITFGLAPVKQEGAAHLVDPDEWYIKEHYAVAIDRALDGMEFTSFCLAHRQGGVTTVLGSKCVSQEDLEDCDDPVINHVLDVAHYEGIIVISEEQMQHLSHALQNMPSVHDTRYVHR